MSVVRALILGASLDVNDSDVNGITPLHLAAAAGHHEVAATLIDEGGRVHIIALHVSWMEFDEGGFQNGRVLSVLVRLYLLVHM